MIVMVGGLRKSFCYVCPKCPGNLLSWVPKDPDDPDDAPKCGFCRGRMRRLGT